MFVGSAIPRRANVAVMARPRIVGPAPNEEVLHATVGNAERRDRMKDIHAAGALADHPAG